MGSTVKLRKVLLVDDDRNIRRIGELSLGLIGGIEVTLADSGPHAVELAANDPPDVVLLDVSMPEVDGPSTLKLLHANPVTANVPIIFLTAWTQDDEVAHLLSLGAVGVIAKPFDPMTLAADVERCFGDRP